MALLRGTVLPRMLLGIFGVLSIVLFVSSLQTVLASGLAPDSGLICLIAGLLAWICLWAAAGKTAIFIRER